jgi:pimeloyl-ACP methyl ester carboxylesterase
MSEASHAFTAAHRGGAGPPLVCLHGFMDTWRGWELVLPALERRYDVLAPTLAGHAGGPPLPAEVTEATLADGVERVMDAVGWKTAHLVGNSLGGFVALQLAARGRAESVVAFAPAGGWDEGDSSFGDLLVDQVTLLEQLKTVAPFADEIVATAEGRRRVTQLLCVRFEHIPVDLLAHIVVGAAACTWSAELVEQALVRGWELDAERIACPVRVAWGRDDRVLPWPSAAERFRRDWLPRADWIVLDDVAHCPQLDVPLESAELIGGFAAR